MIKAPKDLAIWVQQRWTERFALPEPLPPVLNMDRLTELAATRDDGAAWLAASEAVRDDAFKRGGLAALLMDFATEEPSKCAAFLIENTPMLFMQNGGEA